LPNGGAKPGVTDSDNELLTRINESESFKNASGHPAVHQDKDSTIEFDIAELSNFEKYKSTFVRPQQPDTYHYVQALPQKVIELGIKQRREGEKIANDSFIPLLRPGIQRNSQLKAVSCGRNSRQAEMLRTNSPKPLYNQVLLQPLPPKDNMVTKKEDLSPAKVILSNTSASF